MGPTFAFGRPLSFHEAMGMYTCQRCDDPESVLYRDFIAASWRQGNPFDWATDHGVVVTTLSPPFDPQGALAEGFIRSVRAAIDRRGDVRFVLGTGLSDRYDVEDAVWRRLPAVLGACAAVLVVIVAVGMRSVVVGVRLAITVGLTLSWVYGAGVVVFQTTLFTGMSDRLSDIHAGGADGAIFWMAPTLTFSVVLGLACDYDVFICTRIRELRSKGYSDRAAILLAIDKTGSVVTCAGLIMVVTFGSMMLSSQTIIVQAGFFLAFGALVDTFIVRVMLVPSLMLLLRQYNWWPSAMRATVGEGLPLSDGDDDDSGAEALINQDGGASVTDMALTSAKIPANDVIDIHPPAPRDDPVLAGSR